MDNLRSEQSHLVSRNHPQVLMLDRAAQSTRCLPR